MGCGGSVAATDSIVLEGADAELPPEVEGEVKPEEGKIPLTSRPDGWEKFPAPELTAEVVEGLDPLNNPPQMTPVTKPPKKKGIWVKPSPKCIMPVVFHFEGASADTTTIVEMKEFDSPDDIFKDWTPQVELSSIEGVCGLWPIAPGTVLSGLAPNRYMFRWNHGGVRTCGPGQSLNLVSKVAAFLTSHMGSAEAAAAEAMAAAEEAAAEAEAKGEDAAAEAQAAAAEGSANAEGGASKMANMPEISPERMQEIMDQVLAAFQTAIKKCKEECEDMIPDDCYLLGDASEALEKFKADLLSWVNINTPRDLPDWLGPIKTAFIEFEDNYIYNMIEVQADVHNALGYFKKTNDGWEGSTTLKEKAINYVIEKAPAQAEKALEVVKDKSMEIMVACVVKLLGLISLSQKEAFPGLMDQVQERVDKMSMNLAGLSKDVDHTLNQWDIDRPCQRDWMLSDRDESERKKRIEDVYYTVASKDKGSGVSRLAHCIPEYFYEVEIYIVFKKGKENTFKKKPYLKIWQENSTEADGRRIAMTPYFTGIKPEEDGEEDGGEEGEDEEEEEEEEEGEEEEEDEEEEDEDDEYTWRGFHVTAPVLPGRAYCYAVIIDNKVYTSDSKARKKGNFCKKFKLEVGVADWGVNPLRMVGLI